MKKFAKYNLRNFLMPMFLLLISSVALQAQDIKHIVNSISEAYNTSYSINVQYKYTSVDGTTQLSVGKYIKGEGFTYLDAFGSETIEGDTFLLSINHSDKIISYTRREKKSVANRSLADSLLNLFMTNGNISHTEHENTGKLRILLKYSQMNEIVLVYNRDDFTIKEFKLINRIGTEEGILKETVSMVFLEQKRYISVDKSKYNLSRYLRIDGNQIVPVAAYKEYQVYSLF